VQAYLDLAATLKSLLQQIEGFVSVERFESLTHPGKYLSLSFWEDESAIARWRNVEAHRLAQARGRASLFADYRLRIGPIMRDYGMQDRAQAPADSGVLHPSSKTDPR
jgi:heme-degrading monooxygenase HmoA